MVRMTTLVLDSVGTLHVEEEHTASLLCGKPVRVGSRVGSVDWDSAWSVVSRAANGCAQCADYSHGMARA